MKNKHLYIIWGGLYCLCFGFGWFSAPAGVLKGFMLLLSLLFFVPPVWLLVNAFRTKDTRVFRILRWISGMALALTFLILLLSILSLAAPEWVGNFLQVLLNLVSVPLACSGQYALGLFLWACVFFSTFFVKIRKNP